MDARQLPEMVAEQIAVLSTAEGQEVYFASQNEFLGEPLNPQQKEAVLKAHLANMEGGDLYYVTKEMTFLTRGAMPSMPEFRLDESDIPAPYGLIFFDAPIGTVDVDSLTAHSLPPDLRAMLKPSSIRACLWFLARHPDGRVGVTFLFFTLRSRLMEIVRDAGYPATGPLPPFLHDDDIWVALDEVIDMDTPPDWKEWKQLEWARAVVCSWVLMQQPVASVTTVEADRAGRRRLARAGHDTPSPVRIITLRHTSKANSHTGESGREYHHQWVVNGHWRNHWYPKEKRHKPVWITPYIKGPEGAPILGGEKVHVWKR